jgi:hypothetical protein
MDTCRSSANEALLYFAYMRVIARRFYALAVADIRVIWRRRGVSGEFGGAIARWREPAIHNS